MYSCPRWNFMRTALFENCNHGTYMLIIQGNCNSKWGNIQDMFLVLSAGIPFIVQTPIPTIIGIITRVSYYSLGLEQQD